jgi:hypothetical protein
MAFDNRLELALGRVGSVGLDEGNLEAASLRLFAQPGEHAGREIESGDTVTLARQ